MTKPKSIDLKENGVVVVGRAGWMYWFTSADTDVRVQLVDTNKGLHVRGVYIATVSEDKGLTRAPLRNLPLGALQRALTAGPLVDAVQESWNMPEAPDLQPHACSTRKAERIRRAAEPDAPDLSLKLGVPSSERYPDLFYSAVEITYANAARNSRRPAADIAEANGVPVSRVHSWLKEARRRRAEHESQQTVNTPELIAGRLKALEPFWDQLLHPADEWGYDEE